MSLQVLNAHTGQRLSATPSAFASLDAFKSWLATTATIPVAHQILLTSSGKQAKFNALSTEADIFVYNRQLISPSSADANKRKAPTLEQPNSQPPVSLPPDTLAHQDHLEAWQDLFSARTTWARNVLDRCTHVSADAQSHCDALTVIERGVGVAVGNLEAHVTALQHHHREARDWSNDVVQQQKHALATVDTTLTQLKSLPAESQFRDLLPLLFADPSNTPRTQPSRDGSRLDSFVDSQTVNAAIDSVSAGVKTISDTTDRLGGRVRDVSTRASSLFQSVDQAQAHSVANISRDVSQLMEEIQVMVQKVSSDCEHVLGLPDQPKSVSQASKMAVLHTRNYLPSLKDYSAELDDLLSQSLKQRNSATSRGLENMQEVAAIEGLFAQVDSQVKSLDFEPEAAESSELVSLVNQLPFVYGALLVEAVRRREWAEKIRSESATLAEDIAGYREEEERRRKKWAKNFGSFVSQEAATAAALNFDLNLQPEAAEWPEVDRDTIHRYIEALQSIPGLEDAVEELKASVKDLDRPTRRQVKTAKGFRNGSLHEATNMRGSFLLRDGEEAKVLRDTNNKLEEEVKSQKSRVRKLEDLLYKQSQSGRPSSGHAFQITGTPVSEVPGRRLSSTPPTHIDDLLARASSSPRKASAGSSQEEKALARRIVDLEAELMQEKQKRLELEASATGKRDSHAQVRKELEEQQSTKRDLMANLEAQQREFASERRLLEEEISKQKQRIEDTEDELDRILGSRDTERVGSDEKFRALQTDLEQANKMHQDAQEETRRRQETHDEQLRTLRGVYTTLASESADKLATPELINALEELSERTVRQARDLSQVIGTIKSEKEELQTLLERKEKDSLDTQQQIRALEGSMTAVRDQASTEKARADSLAEELEDGRKQLKTLRAKFAEGETGSESLRQRVEEQAARASNLSTELAKSQSHVNGLDVELSNMQRKYQDLLTSSNKNTATLEQRSAKSRELTYKLVSHNQEMVKLLEPLGLTAIRRDGKMTIQRSSKLSSASTALMDANGSISGSTVLPSNYELFDTAIEPSLLTWLQSEDPMDEDKKFTNLINKLDDFNLNTFSEAIIKLRRDIEWTGKKWKMEARNYRDKYHRAQSEAHDKIAFRSFRDGDLALFLPTRNQATRPWAAFNVGAPHYFLREQDAHKLRNREWLVARISKIEERVVDLSRTMTDSLKVGDRRSIGETSEGGTTIDDDNPFELSDGLRWYLLDAAEEKPGAPTTPGLGKSTVASANVDVKGSIRMKKTSAGNDASTKLNKSLESRRSSSNSKRGSISGGVGPLTGDSTGTPIANDEATSRGPAPTHLRPGSRSSGNVAPGSSGLGIEVNKPGDSTSDEPRIHVPPTGTSPSRSGLMGLFGSPPKTLVPRGNSSLREVSPSKPADEAEQPGKAKEVSVTASRPRPSPSRGHSSQSARPSPSKSMRASTTESPTKPKANSAWESLWSLDVSLEEKGKGKR